MHYNTDTYGCPLNVIVHAPWTGLNRGQTAAEQIRWRVGRVLASPHSLERAVDGLDVKGVRVEGAAGHALDPCLRVGILFVGGVA